MHVYVMTMTNGWKNTNVIIDEFVWIWKRLLTFMFSFFKETNYNFKYPFIKSMLNTKCDSMPE